MASPWENIMASPEFSAMTPEQKQRTRDIFFDEAIAPEAAGNPEVLEKARGYFNSQFDFMPKPQPEQDPGAMAAFLKSAKHEAGAGILGGIGAALGAMGAGALAGAEAGSIVPGWGTLIGGVAGALTGGFLGKKTQQAIQGQEQYEKEAQELAKLGEQHPIATSTGALLPTLPTMMLSPGAGAVTRMAGIGDEVANVAAQGIKKYLPTVIDKGIVKERTAESIAEMANRFRLMKPADAVKYAESLGLKEDAVQAIQNAAVSTGQRLAGQALESGAQMGIMSAGESAAQVAEGNKSWSDVPGDVLKGTVAGAPLGLMGPVSLGKGRLGAALGGALAKGPVDAALMATGEEAYDAATGRSEGFSFQRAGERALGMLPSFSLLAGGMGVFHGAPEFKNPAEAEKSADEFGQLPEVAKAKTVQQHEAVQKYLDAKASGDQNEINKAIAAWDEARKAAAPPPAPIDVATDQLKQAGSSPEPINAAQSLRDRLNAQNLQNRLNAQQAAMRAAAQEAKLKEQQNAIQERPAEEVGTYTSGNESPGRTEESGRVGPSEQGLAPTEETNGKLRQEDQIVKELNKEVEVVQPQVDIGGMEESSHDRFKLTKPYPSISITEIESLSPKDWSLRRDYLAGRARLNQQEKNELLKKPKYNWESIEYNENARINEVAASLRAAIQDMQLARPDLEAEFRAKGGTQTEGGGESEVTNRAEGETRDALVDIGRGGGELRREPEALQSFSSKSESPKTAGITKGEISRESALHSAKRSMIDEGIRAIKALFSEGQSGLDDAIPRFEAEALAKGGTLEDITFAAERVLKEWGADKQYRDAVRKNLVRLENEFYDKDFEETIPPPSEGQVRVGAGERFPETQREDRPAVVEEKLTPEVAESTREITPEPVTISDEEITQLAKGIQDTLAKEGIGEPPPGEELILNEPLPEDHNQYLSELENDSWFKKVGDKIKAAFRKYFSDPNFDQSHLEGLSDFVKKNADRIKSKTEHDLARGVKFSKPEGEEARARAESPDLAAARGNLEEAQKAFDEAHQPIPLESTPEQADAAVERMAQTAKNLREAKEKLKYEAIKDLTKHLPWEQRSKEMEGIADVDTLEEHKQAVKDAAAQRKPVSAEAAKEYGIKLDPDYEVDRFGIARPSLDKRIQPFKEYSARGAKTGEKVSADQVREAVKMLPKVIQKILKKSGFNVITREEASKMGGVTPEFAAKAEGFYHDGKIYVIPENIVVTTADANALKAAARVLVHENLHEAFDAVIAKDPKAMEEWKGLLKQIPENDLEALARTYEKGEDWRRNEKAVTDLAEEWLAKKWEDYQAGKMAEAEKPIFERILNSIRKIIERVFGGVRQFKTQDEDLEAFFDKLSKNRLRVQNEKANQEKLRLSTRGDEESEHTRARLRLRSEVARISEATLREMGISETVLAKLDTHVLRGGEREREGFKPVSAGITEDGRIAISFDFRDMDTQMPMGIENSPQAREKFVQDSIKPELPSESKDIRFSIPTSEEVERERQFGKNLFGISMEAMRQQAAELDLPPLDRAKLNLSKDEFDLVKDQMFGNPEKGLMPTDPDMGKRATDRILSGEGGLATQTEEIAIALEGARLTKQLTALDDRLGEPGISRADSESILNQIDDIKTQINRSMQALYESGTKLSRAFYVRQMLFNNKYELQSIYRRARRAKGGKELTKEEHDHIFNQAQRILKDTEAFDKLEREKDKLKIPDLIDLIAKQVEEIKAKGQNIGDEGEAVKRETPPAPGLKGFDLAYESVSDFLKEKINKVDSLFSRINDIERIIRERGLRAKEGIKASLAADEASHLSDAEIIQLRDKLVAEFESELKGLSAITGIERKAKTPKTILEEAKKKIAELNEPIEPSKPRKRTPLQQLLDEHSDTRMGLDDFVKRSEELGLDKETATQLYRDFNVRKGAYAQELPDSVYGRLLRKFVEEGERDTNEIAKKISKWLGDNGYGEISPEDVMERVSGYGKKVFPSQEEVAKISRQKRAEMLVLSQIRDIEKKLKAPELTGAQRDKAHAELRELMKKRNDLMRDLGIQRQSPEAQFANARDRAIRALENRREELLRILSGEQEYRRRENKTRIKDADEQALYDEVRKLSDQVHDLYDKDEPITAEKWNAEKERRLTKTIEALQKRIKEGDFLPKDKLEFERTEAVKSLEDTLESLREDFNQMKDAAHPELKIEAKQKAITKALNDRINDLNKIIENGRELREKSDVPETQEMKEARETIKELNEKLKVKEWPERRLESLQKSLDRADKAINDNLPPEAKKKYEDLKTLEIKQAEELLKDKRYTRLLQAQERKWNEKLAKGDFAPKKREERVLNEKQKEIKARIDQTKENIDKAIKDLEWKQLTPLEKAAEYAVRWKRFAILSSPVSVLKLSTAATTRAGTMGIENFMRTPLDILYPEFAKVGTLEQRVSASEYAKAMAKAWTEGMADAEQTLKKGQSELDKKYGKGNLEKEGWTNFFGRMHGMLKAPVKRAAFELAMTKQIKAFRIEKGRDPSLDEQIPMGFRAYEWANRQIFMNDNAATSAWNSMLSTLEHKDMKTAAALFRFLLPIVKVPTNIAIETLQHTPLGFAKGAYDMMKVVRGGLDSIKDKPEVVEAIQRNFRKGAIGTGLLMLGAAMPQIAGGFYEKGEKRHEDEPDFGEMMIGGVKIPKWALHAPFFEVIQLGSTFRRAVDESLKKHGEREYSEGAIAGLKGVAEELPFIAEMARVSDAFDNQKSRNRFLGDLAASSVIPAFSGYLARKSDTEAPESASLLEKLNAPTVKRETVGNTLGETIKKSMQAQVPGLREQLLPRVDNPFGPGVKIPKQLQEYEKAGHPMPSVSTRTDFEKGYGKVSDARWLSYVSNRGRGIRQAMAEKYTDLMQMNEEDKRRAIQQITKHASSEARKAIGLSA